MGDFIIQTGLYVIGCVTAYNWGFQKGKKSKI